MELMPGYKTTDIGIIPCDWEATTIGEVAMFSGGSQPPRSTFKFSPATGYVRLIQIRDYKTDAYPSYIPAALARKTCSADDIMIGRYGPPIFQILRGIEGAYNVALIKAIPCERISRDYLFNILSQEKLFQLIDSLSRRSSGQTGIEMPALKAYGLPLPPIEEQHNISSVLSDVDNLLATLEKMICKKRDLKQASMQQLLTGSIQLAGFNSKWLEVPLGEIVKPQKGQLITTKTIVPGDIPVIAGGKQPAYFHASANRYGKTITVSASGASAGYVAFHASPIFASDCSTISESEQYCIEFIYYALQLRQEEIYAAQTGGAQPHIQPKDLAPILIKLPEDLTEQTEIASVLSDMDAEISELETRRDKTHNIKQAMMQELLTGKTRLV